MVELDEACLSWYTESLVRRYGVIWPGIGFTSSSVWLSGDS